MASEKIDVTTTTNSYTNEVGEKGYDAELQACDFNLSPADAARQGILEVCLLNCNGNKCDKTDRVWAEVHQSVVDHLLQYNHSLLVGISGHHLPVRSAQWWTFGHGLRLHSCQFRRMRCSFLDGRNGLHVCKVIPYETMFAITNVLQRPGSWRAI